MGRNADVFRDTVTSWSDVAELVDHFSYFTSHDWLFRGVRSAKHPLVPKIGRPTTRGIKNIGGKSPASRIPYDENDERAVLSMFRQQARAHLEVQPDTQLEWIALAQHFGLPTRLLDWTDSLLTAVWFAAENGGATKTDSAIWVTRHVPPVQIEDTLDPLRTSEARVYRPPHISPRIVAQGSVLMICPNPTQEPLLPFKRKITIVHKAQFTLKKRLNACGINTRYLFPDLAGLSQHLAWMYKHDWLAGYRTGAR